MYIHVHIHTDIHTTYVNVCDPLCPSPHTRLQSILAAPQRACFYIYLRTYLRILVYTGTVHVDTTSL